MGCNELKKNTCTDLVRWVYLTVVLSPSSWLCRGVLMEVGTAQAHIPSGLEVPTLTAMTTLMFGTASGLEPARTPAPWAGASHPSCPRMTLERQMCIWATQEPLAQRWQPRFPVSQKWQALLDAALRMWWRTFWTISTCSPPTTLRSEVGQKPLDPPSRPLLPWCSLAPGTRLTVHPAWSRSLSRTTTSACMAKPEWTACHPCHCRHCRRASPALGRRWAHITAPRDFWKSCLPQTQTSTESWCRQLTPGCPSPAGAACYHLTVAPSMQPNWEGTVTPTASVTLTPTACTKPWSRHQLWMAAYSCL